VAPYRRDRGPNLVFWNLKYEPQCSVEMEGVMCFRQIQCVVSGHNDAMLCVKAFVVVSRK
jgi:hypothetical protein